MNHQAPILAAKDLYAKKRERSLSKKKTSDATSLPGVEKLLTSCEKEKIRVIRRQPVAKQEEQAQSK